MAYIYDEITLNQIKLSLCVCVLYGATCVYLFSGRSKNVQTRILKSHLRYACPPSAAACIYDYACILYLRNAKDYLFLCIHNLIL